MPVIVVKAYPSDESGFGSLTGRFHTGEPGYPPLMGGA
jgi:hypothetical protein